MSVNDEQEYPFLVPEKALVKKAVTQGSTVLGICLGAQMIAAACGKPGTGARRNSGWRKITGSNTSGYRFFPGNLWFSTGIRRPSISRGAHLLATGTAVKNQAFMLNNALGVQFHPEGDRRDHRLLGTRTRR